MPEKHGLIQRVCGLFGHSFVEKPFAESRETLPPGFKRRDKCTTCGFNRWVFEDGTPIPGRTADVKGVHESEVADA